MDGYRRIWAGVLHRMLADAMDGPAVGLRGKEHAEEVESRRISMGQIVNMDEAFRLGCIAIGADDPETVRDNFLAGRITRADLDAMRSAISLD